MPAPAQIIPLREKGFRLQGRMYGTIRAGQRLADGVAPKTRNHADRSHYWLTSKARRVTQARRPTVGAGPRHGSHRGFLKMQTK